MKFEVLRGVHSEGGQRFTKGEIVDSITDLNKLNPASYPPKFREMPDSVEPTYPTKHNIKNAAAEKAAAEKAAEKAASEPKPAATKARTVTTKPKNPPKTMAPRDTSTSEG